MDRKQIVSAVRLPWFEEKRPYKTFITQTFGSSAYFGVAFASPQFASDLSTLGVSWYYTWGYSTSIHGYQFVPMSYYGQVISQLPYSYSNYLLVFNEPDNEQPFGCNLMPEDAAARYVVLRACYPKAKLVVGGWMLTDHEWIQRFCDTLAAGNIPYPTYWHAHAYIDYSWYETRHVAKYLQMHRDLTGGVYWVTEYGTYSGDVDHFREMTYWMMAQRWIERIAPFTNRQPRDARWAGPATLDMFFPDGSLTPIGQAYVDIIRSGEKVA